jgi:hypothetical protein
LFLSCSNDDDWTSFEGDEDFNGAWRLTNVTCYCSFGTETDFGATIVTFVSDNDTVTIEHSGTDTFFKEEGTHSYQGS